MEDYCRGREAIILAKRTAACQAIITVPRDTQYAVSLIVIDQKIV